MNKTKLQERIKSFVDKKIKEMSTGGGAGAGATTGAGYADATPKAFKKKNEAKTPKRFQNPPKSGKGVPTVFTKGTADLSAYKNIGYREVKPSEMIDAKYLWAGKGGLKENKIEYQKIIDYDIDPTFKNDVPNVEVELIDDGGIKSPDAAFKVSAFYHDGSNGKMRIFKDNPMLQKAVTALLQKEFQKTFRRVIHGVLGEPFGLKENINPTDTIKTDVPLFIRLLEYARENAKTDMDLHNVTEKVISLSSTGKTLTMSDYDNIVKKQSLNESRYSQFKKQTEVVKPSTQMHVAIREIKKRLQEVNKIAGYTKQLRSELSESNDVAYNKRTEAYLEQLMKETATLYKNLKQIKENGKGKSINS
jgi:hypothetical protein